jgi:dTDP-4-dehydrorhamnose reductase
MDHLRMKLAAQERIELSDQELHSFASVEGFTELVERVIESGLRNKTIHYSGLTKVSHYEWARLFAKRFNYNQDLIQAKRTSTGGSTSYVLPPLDYSLNSTQTYEILKIKPLLLEESFDLIEKKLISRS